jgi:hypothetical protein
MRSMIRMWHKLLGNYYMQLSEDCLHDELKMKLFCKALNHNEKARKMENSLRTSPIARNRWKLPKNSHPYNLSYKKNSK